MIKTEKYISWNKGLSKETDVRVALIAKKVSIARTGKKLPEHHAEKLRIVLDRERLKRTAIPGSFRQNHPEGYWEIKTLDGWRYLHRYIVEQELGITLKKYQHVHHQDRDPSNNHISNLEVMNGVKHLQYHSESKPLTGRVLKCKSCGKRMYTVPHRLKTRKFCSYRCMGDSKINKIRLICPTCQKVFYKRPSQYAATKNHYCSPTCWYSRK